MDTSCINNVARDESVETITVKDMEVQINTTNNIPTTKLEVVLNPSKCCIFKIQLGKKNKINRTVAGIPHTRA
jgi:hypothetical protein